MTVLQGIEIWIKTRTETPGSLPSPLYSIMLPYIAGVIAGCWVVLLHVVMSFWIHHVVRDWQAAAMCCTVYDVVMLSLLFSPNSEAHRFTVCSPSDLWSSCSIFLLDHFDLPCLCLCSKWQGGVLSLTYTGLKASLSLSMLRILDLFK